MNVRDIFAKQRAMMRHSSASENPDSDDPFSPSHGLVGNEPGGGKCLVRRTSQAGPSQGIFLFIRLKCYL